MSNDDLLPKWLPNTELKTTKSQTLLKLILIVTLMIFSLGLVTMADHASNGMKGKH
jgi:hypothetical protein